MIDDEPTLDLDDGATELLSGQAARRVGPTIEFGKIAGEPAGGRLAKARMAARHGLTHFVILRTPLGATKIPLSYAGVYHHVWTLWSTKRLHEEADPGVTIAEIMELEKSMASARVRQVLTSLTHSRILRLVTTHAGYQGTRTRYYPTQSGVQTFALAEVLGMGSCVQVGPASKVWLSKTGSEPTDFFEFASLLRGKDSLVRT